MIKKLIAFAAVVMLATQVQAFTPKDASHIFLDGAGIETATAGSAYTYAPGLGGAGGFALAAAGLVDSTVDGLSEVIGTTIDMAGAPIDSLDTQVGGPLPLPHTITLDMVSTAGDLAPSGFTVGGFPADTAGVFLGANAGGTPLSFDFPPIVTLAEISVTDLAGAVSGPFDITGFSNFTAGPGGSWDGSLGVSFGAGTNGVSAYKLEVTYVPEPASSLILGLCSLLGLGIFRRR